MKKILSLILCLIVVFTSTTNVVFADEDAYAKSLAKTETVIDYLNEIYLSNNSLALDVDYCSDEDVELLTSVANYITKDCNSDSEKAESIYNWMINNISYGDSSFSPIDVYKNKVGLCSGQSQLMSTLFRLSGIPSAIVRASKQGTNEIESLEMSNYYIDKKPHEFVMAYVDGGWYGYDSCWKWSHMEKEHIADQYVLLHVDGILVYSENAWDFDTWSWIDTWYIDGEYKAISNGEVAESGGKNLQVGGCLQYDILHYNSSSKYYYVYQGSGENVNGNAFLGGYYLTQSLNGSDVVLVQDNGVQEQSYFYYDGQKYFNGVKIDDEIIDIGLTNNYINLYLGETFDLSDTFPGFSIKCSNDCLTIDGSVITANTVGNCKVNIYDGTKYYTINFHIENFVLDELSQELCDHDHIIDGTCKYCGKQFETEKEEVVEPTVEEPIIEEEPVVEVVEETKETIVEEPKQEEIEVKDEVVKEPVIEKKEIVEHTIVTQPTVKVTTTKSLASLVSSSSSSSLKSVFASLRRLFK